jgi:hypothetical protein
LARDVGVHIGGLPWRWTRAATLSLVRGAAVHDCHGGADGQSSKRCSMVQAAMVTTSHTTRALGRRLPGELRAKLSTEIQLGQRRDAIRVAVVFARSMERWWRSSPKCS